MTEFILSPDAPKVRDNLVNFIRDLSDRRKWVVTVKRYVKTRTKSQNALMWVWVEKAAKKAGDADGCSKDMMHKRFKKKFLTPIETFEEDGELFAIYSTKGLSAREMSDYMEKITWYCATNMGLVLEAIPREFSAASEGIALPQPEEMHCE